MIPDSVLKRSETTKDILNRNDLSDLVFLKILRQEIERNLSSIGANKDSFFIVLVLLKLIQERHVNLQRHRPDRLPSEHHMRKTRRSPLSLTPSTCEGDGRRPRVVLLDQCLCEGKKPHGKPLWLSWSYRASYNTDQSYHSATWLYTTQQEWRPSCAHVTFAY